MSLLYAIAIQTDRRVALIAWSLAAPAILEARQLPSESPAMMHAITVRAPSSRVIHRLVHQNAENCN